MFNAQKIDSTMGYVLDLETSGITYLKNIVLLSYIKPRSLGSRITNFLMKCKTILIKEVEKLDSLEEDRRGSKIQSLKSSKQEVGENNAQDIDWNSMTEIWQLLRKFCTNIFKSENEDIIYQILDLKLAECTMKYIRACSGEGVIVKELLSMVAMFMIDEELVEYFMSSNLLQYMETMLQVGKKYMRGDGEDSKVSLTGSKHSIFSIGNVENYARDPSYVMNIIIIVINLFEHKSYAFTKQLKIDYLAFLLSHYSQSNDAKFKKDLINLLILIYKNKEFRDLMSDREVISELKYRTEISQLEDLIHIELEKNLVGDGTSHETISHQEEENPLDPTPVKEWQEFFPSFTLLQNNYIAQVNIPQEIEDNPNFNKDNFEFIVPKNTGPKDKKFIILEQFFDYLTSKFYQNPNLKNSILKNKQNLIDLRSLVSMEYDTQNVKWLERFDELNKTNHELREMVVTLDEMVKRMADKNREMERTMKWNKINENKNPPGSNQIQHQNHPYAQGQTPQGVQPTSNGQRNGLITDPPISQSRNHGQPIQNESGQQRMNQNYIQGDPQNTQGVNSSVGGQSNRSENQNPNQRPGDSIRNSFNSLVQTPIIREVEAEYEQPDRDAERYQNPIQEVEPYKKPKTSYLARYEEPETVKRVLNPTQPQKEKTDPKNSSSNMFKLKQEVDRQSQRQSQKNVNYNGETEDEEEDEHLKRIHDRIKDLDDTHDYHSRKKKAAYIGELHATEEDLTDSYDPQDSNFLHLFIP